MIGPYTPILSSHAQRDLDQLKGKILRRIQKAIDELRQDPRGPGTKKLKVVNSYSKRCGRDYRILYEIDDTARRLLIDRIGHRKDIYRI
jgi:mRNA interferase RelE/StbE